MTTETTQLTELITKIINDAQKKDKPFTIEFDYGVSVRLDNRDAFIESLDHLDMTDMSYDVKIHNFIDALMVREDRLLEFFEEHDNLMDFIDEINEHIWITLTDEAKKNVKEAFQKYFVKHMEVVNILLKNDRASVFIPEQMKKYGTYHHAIYAKLFEAINMSTYFRKDLVAVYKKMICDDLTKFVCKDLLNL